MKSFFFAVEAAPPGKPLRGYIEALGARLRCSIQRRGPQHIREAAFREGPGGRELPRLCFVSFRFVSKHIFNYENQIFYFEMQNNVFCRASFHDQCTLDWSPDSLALVL